MASAEKRVGQVLQLCSRLGDKAKAVKLLKRFCETAYSQWEEQALLRWRHMQLALAPGDIDALLAVAWTLFQRGELAAALARVDQALALEPKRRYAFQIRARVYLQQGRLEQAEQAARQAAEDPDYAWPRATLARVLVAQGRLTEAAAAADEAWKMAQEEGELQEGRRAVRMALRASEAMVKASRSDGSESITSTMRITSKPPGRRRLKISVNSAG